MKKDIAAKIENSESLNEKYNLFHETLLECINKNVPYKDMTNKEIKRSKKPWVTKEYLSQLKPKTPCLKNTSKHRINFVITVTNAIGSK